MQKFFAPAIALMDRMGYAKKFAVVGMVSLTAIAVMGYNLHASLDPFVKFSQRELKGLDLIGPVSRAIQGMQEHRGISEMLLAGHGDEALRDRRAARAKAVDAAIGALEGKLSAGLASEAGLRSIQADWENLRKGSAGRPTAESFAAHTRLIGRIQAYEVEIADEYALTLDPEHSTYYLIDTVVNKLPHAIEHIGQLRAYGVGILARRQVSEAQKLRLRILMAELDHSLDELDANLEKIGRRDPEMRGTVSAVSKDIADSARRVTALVESDILTGRFAMEPDAFFGVATASIDRIYAQLRESMTPMAEALIGARVAEAEKTLRMSVGVAFLLLLAVAYLMGGIYCAIAGNVRALARSARAFAGGDTRERVRLGTRDELGKVGDSFNEMADGFSALLDAQRESSLHLEDRVKERTKELERARVETDALLRRNQALMNTARDGIHIMDAQGNVVEVNDAFCAMLGYSREEALRLNVADWDAHFSEEALRVAFTDLIGNSALIETRHRRKDGTVIDVEVGVAGIEIDGKVLLFASSRDITARKQAEEEIRNLAFYDPLTGLPNRRLLIERLRAALHASARHGSHGAVMFIDLDRFKSLNDMLGHECGDLMLQEVARRIKAVVREVDTVARLGGDEFIVLVEDIDADQGGASRKAGLVAEKIREALAQPYRLNGHEHRSSPSIGISLYHGNREPVDVLLQHADMAMYQAKESGRNAVRFFDPAMQRNVAEHAALENDLRGAPARRQLRLFYQMQVDKDHRPLGAEALLRWVHPERGMILPGRFIPVAEESSLIVEIGQWVMETALRQLALWSEDSLMRDLTLAVNVSARQFAMPDFVDSVARILAEHRVDPGRLKLELTESVVLDDLAGTVGKMHALRDLGIQLSMDDFGTGYSSLTYLKQLPLDQIKIDQEFIRGIAAGGSDALLVRTIIDLASNFRLNVIAEGVETEGELAFLKHHDCMAYQGYLFGKPVPIEEFEALMADHMRRRGADA